jgi:hypothetical protein
LATLANKRNQKTKKSKSTTTKAARKGPHATPLGSYLSITAGAGAASLLSANGAVVYYNGAAVTATVGQILYWDPITMTAGTGSMQGDRFNILNAGTNYVYSALTNTTIRLELGVVNGNVTAKLDVGATIDVSTAWLSSFTYMDRSGWTTAQSLWATGQDGTTGNIPFRFYKNVALTDKYYGWANITYNDVANTLVLNNFAYNNTPNASISAGSVVPEPSSMLLLAMGGTTVLAARRRRRDNQASAAIAS